MAFTAPVDIAKRALQHLGQPTISALTESNPQATQSNFCYPLLRQAELRRAPWTFAARRAVLRARTATTYRMTAVTYSAATTYGIGDVVQDSSGFLWLSVRASNTANTPGTGGVNPYWIAYFGPTVADAWASGTFFPGDVVYVSTTAYIATPAVGTSITSQNPTSGAPWHVISGATVASMLSYDPRGLSLTPSAAASTATQRLIYDLPANFMRIAPQDVKSASTPRQLLTGGQQYNDFEIEGPFLYSNATGPIIFRFTADYTDVSTMEPLFCELLALNMARQMAMILTGSRETEARMEMLYRQLANDARTVSLIEGGSTELEPPTPTAQPQETTSTRRR